MKSSQFTVKQKEQASLSNTLHNGDIPPQHINIEREATARNVQNEKTGHEVRLGGGYRGRTDDL